TENAESHALESSIAQKMENPTRWRVPSPGRCGNPRARVVHPLGNCRISRAGEVPRSGIEKSHAQERSPTRKMRKLTRRRAPSLGNSEIPRAGKVDRSETAEFHASERSTTRKMQQLTLSSDPPLGKCGIP